MYVLGINHWLHDSAAALLKDGVVVAALEEERWYRDDKHTNTFPKRTIRWCIEKARELDPDLTIEHVAINLAPVRCYGDAAKKSDLLLNPGSWGDKERRKAHKHLKNSLERTHRDLRHTFRACGLSKDFTLHEVPHHDAHVGSTFNVCGWDEAAILTLDGLGEWATTTLSKGSGNTVERVKTIGLPHSIGTFYASLTDYLGFKRNNDEYKVMGLASYGDPKPFRGAFTNLIKPTEKGGFEVNTDFFEVNTGVLFPGERLNELLGGPPRERESELTQRHKDIAAALQERTEEIGLHLANYLHEQTGLTKLCMAGGVALNCVMNTRILVETAFDELYVQPAAYDAGGALGAASWVTHQVLDKPRSFNMDHVYFGPEYSDEQIEKVLKAGMLRYRKADDIALETAKLVADGKIVGWFQGRAEFGPRALGKRSILADPTNTTMQDHVNLRVKHREDFRPFAPSVAHERFQEIFDSEADDLFMTKVVPVRPEFHERLPAITHVDGTARIHTVREELNPLYHRMISEFAKLRELPVVLNTSFNVRGEPMVLTPQDALRCFFTTGIDHLAIGSFVVDK